jgi:hypothetical protein
MWPYGVAVLIAAALSLALAWRTTRKPISALPDTSRGFGRRDEVVTVVFADGSSKQTTLGEIEQKVKEINGQHFWVEKKWDLWISAVSTLIGLVSTAVVYFLQKWGY